MSGGIVRAGCKGTLRRGCGCEDWGLQGSRGECSAVCAASFCSLWSSEVGTRLHLMSRGGWGGGREGFSMGAV